MKNSLLSILCILFACHAQAATYYASPTGSGTTCSEGSPCALEYTIETKAGSGDTVVVTAGSYEQASQISFANPMTIQGQGSPTITSTLAAGTALMSLTPAADGLWRITGINFVHGSNDAANYPFIQVNGKTDNSFCVGSSQPTTGLRIDNNTFTKGGHQVYVIGCVYGVINSNTFTNGNISMMVVGDDDYSWARAIAPGTVNSLFIEDNQFTANADYGTGSINQFVYQQSGARTVTRYNTMTATAYDNSVCGEATCPFSFFDSHGNQGECTDVTSTLRGQPLIEVYNNTMAGYRVQDFLTIRGGSSLIHDNTLTYSSAMVVGDIVFWEEEAWTAAQGGNFGSCDPAAVSAWPATDQIFNTFVWDNTLNGAAISDIDLRYSAVEGTYIQKTGDHIEYWMSAPASSGGKLSFGGAAGIANNACTAASTPAACCTGDGTGTCDMTFSASGANAYYPYTPYTYPHPLRGVTATVSSATISGATIQ